LKVFQAIFFNDFLKNRAILFKVFLKMNVSIASQIPEDKKIVVSDFKNSMIQLYGKRLSNVILYQWFCQTQAARALERL
jgi:hypothetical protein